VDSQGLRLDDVDLIGHHGVILFHGNGFHVDICEGSVIAERTGIDVITDFRVRDCAAGGQGAPLSPYVDWILFNAPDRCRAVQNIGGIANVCAIPRNATVDDLIGFDTGPGNMIIDGLVGLISAGELAYDRDGAIAASGTVDAELLEELMGHPFIGRGLPKCAGREEFGVFFASDLLERTRAEGRADADVVATATAFTAHAIAGAYKRFVAPKMQLDEVIITGGGAYNPVIMRHLGELLAPTPVVTHDAYGIPAAAREAVSWAVLANETLMGNPANVCQVTGAKRRVVLGKIIPA
jgi:anhydro-N-acetylmuramic acid kinase